MFRADFVPVRCPVLGLGVEVRAGLPGDSICRAPTRIPSAFRTMTRRSRSKPALRGLGGRLLLLGLSTLVGLVFLEIALRIVLPAPPAAAPPGRHAFFAYHPQLGWDHVPGVTEITAAPEFEVTIQLNAAGMRSTREYDAVAPVGYRRIVAVGDSFTFGHGVENDEVFLTRLESSEPALEVLNLAVTGYGVDQQWLKMRDQGLALRPDLVLLGLFEGDVFRNARSEQLGYPKPRFVLAAETLLPPSTPVPETRPPAGWLARSALGRVVAGPVRSLVEHLGLGEAWRLNEAILARAASACRDAGVGFAVVIIPKDQAVYGQGLRRRLHDRTLALIRAQLEALELDYIDLTDGLRRAAEEAPERQLYFPQDGHWTPAGHAVAASLIGERLATWLPPSGAEAP